MGTKITEEQKKSLVEEIISKSKDYKYQIREWDVLTVYNKYTNDNYNIWWYNEIYVPTYQRNLTWDDERKSRFIESLFLNLPIPFIFLNKSNNDSSDIFSLAIHEIIDGSQRIRTVAEFIQNKFKLRWLKDITSLIWYKYEDLHPALQSKFNLTPLRTVIFEWLTEDKRKEMFNRINTSSDALNWMEVRKWTYEGEFYGLLKELSECTTFKNLCPLSPNKENREEWTELILRFFAYTEKYNNYKSYNWKVQDFLDDYMKEKSEFLSLDNISSDFWEEKLFERKREFIYKFNIMLDFVEKYFPTWFKKRLEDKVAGSRVFFESISVWTYLALKEKESLSNEFSFDLNNLLWSVEYKTILTSDWANSPKKFYWRIHIMKHFLTTWEILNEEKINDYLISNFWINEWDKKWDEI